MRPMGCFVAPLCRLLPHVAWFACLCLLCGVGPIATNDMPIMGQSVCLSVCLVALSVCLFYQKPARFYPYVSVHVSRSAMRPIATVSLSFHIAWSVYLCIFRDVHGLFLLMTRIMLSLSVCLWSWLVCMSVISI